MKRIICVLCLILVVVSVSGCLSNEQAEWVEKQNINVFEHIDVDIEDLQVISSYNELRNDQKSYTAIKIYKADDDTSYLVEVVTDGKTNKCILGSGWPEYHNEKKVDYDVSLWVGSTDVAFNDKLIEFAGYHEKYYFISSDSKLIPQGHAFYNDAGQMIETYYNELLQPIRLENWVESPYNLKQLIYRSKLNGNT